MSLSSARADAAKLVCGKYAPTRVAVCLHGDAHVLSLLSLRTHVLDAIGADASNATVVFTRVRGRRVTRAALQRALRGLTHEAVGSLRAFEPRPPTTGTHGGCPTKTSHFSQQLEGLSWCAAAVAAHEREHPGGAVFESVLFVPADLLWVRPLLPRCFHSLTSLDRDRYYGRVWWVRRSSVLQAFAPTEGLPPNATTWDCDATGGISAGHEQRIGKWLADRARRNGAFPDIDTSLAVGVPLSHDGDAPLRPDCHAWRAAMPSSLVPQRRVQLLHPPCPTSMSEATSHLRTDDYDAMLAELTPSALATRVTDAICGVHAGQQDERRVSSSARPPTVVTDIPWRRSYNASAQEGTSSDEVSRPAVAMMLGGLARTFAHPLVHRSLRGHVIEALGCPVAVFAHLRLEDKRGMTAYGKKDLSGVIHTDEQAVKSALAALGADPRDVHLTYSAMAPVPHCDGWQEPVTLPLGKACQSYAEPCAFHALLGQLWSRKELYTLVEAHEARRGGGFAFDQLLFLRPDLTATISWLPWCYHPLGVARHLHDWVWAVPRREGGAALFHHVPDDYYACRSEYTRARFEEAWPHVIDFRERRAESPESDAVGGFTPIHSTGFDIENWMKVRAASHGVQLFLDDTLGTLALTRTNDPRFPHKFDCRFLAIALRALAPPEHEHERGHQLQQAVYSHYRLASYIVQQALAGGRSLAACASITYANPWNY